MAESGIKLLGYKPGATPADEAIECDPEAHEARHWVVYGPGPNPESGFSSITYSNPGEAYKHFQRLNYAYAAGRAGAFADLHKLIGPPR